MANDYMPRPELQTWDEFEEVTPDTMTQRISEPREYYINRAFFSARGVIDNSSSLVARSGQALYNSRIVPLIWDRRRVRGFGFELSSDGTCFIVPEDGIYHLHLHQTTWGTLNNRTGTVVNPLITVTPPNAVGKKDEYSDFAQVQQYQVNYEHYHSTACSVTEFLPKGTWVRARSYLGKTSKGVWMACDGDAETNFSGFMVASSRDGWSSGTPSVPPAMHTWADGEFVSTRMMNDQTTAQFASLQDAARVTTRGFDFSFKGSLRPVTPKWRVSFANARGFEPTQSTISIPWDGIYLISFFGNIVRADPPAAGRPAPFQFATQADGYKSHEGVIAAVRAEHLLDFPNNEAGVLISDTVFLEQGYRFSTSVYGSYPTTWTPFSSDPVPSDRYWNLSLHYLGKG